MSKDVINVGGEEKVVREDTAKAYRGTMWILGVVGMVLVTALILFVVFFGASIFSTDLESPKKIEEKRQSGQ